MMNLAELRKTNTKFENGDIFTIKEFIKYVSSGCLIDYDGWGYFVTSNGIKGKLVRCNVDWLKKNKGKYPFVIWYNR